MSEKQTNENGKQKTILLILAVIGILLVIIFGIRTFRSFTRFHRAPPPPMSEDISSIQGWMDLGYVNKVYGVPPDYVLAELGIPQSEIKRMSLAQLNQRYFPGQKGYVVEQVKKIVGQYQENHPAPNPPPTWSPHE